MSPGQQRNSKSHMTVGSLLFALSMLLSSLSVGCGITTVASSPTPTSPIILQPTATATGTPTPLPTCSTPTEPPGSSQPTPIPPSGWATYTDTVYHYTIQYPANWFVVSGSCAGMAFDVYNYDPWHVGSPPAGGLKIEVFPLPHPSQLSASDFYNQLKQEQQGQPGATPPCPAETTNSLQVDGRDALEVSCPAQNSVVFYVPDGQTMLSAYESISMDGHPSDVLTYMVTSITFTN